MIVITGAAGMIGSCLLSKLNQENFKDIVLVDDFSNDLKNNNFKDKTFTQKVDREDFFTWIDQNHKLIQFIFHLGARSATTGYTKEVYDHLNLNYSKKVWNKCVEYGLPLIYASSAATYGLGEHGYSDNHELIEKLSPLNLYGESKNDFDKWALAQAEQPFYWAGLKFFNVYGPNEYHKGRMSSVVFHTFKQISDSGMMKLFKSHNKDFADGHQTRDFIYSKDTASIMHFLMTTRKQSGIYNVGTGKGRTFLDLAKNTFIAMGKNINIDFIDTPEDIRDKYQYFTEADINKLQSVGYNIPFHTLEEGITDYVQNYLMKNKYV